MRLKVLLITFLGVIIQLSLASDKGWSWGDDSDKLNNATETSVEERSNKKQFILSQEEDLSADTANIDEIVDSIIETGRQGRNLDEFGEVYSDPNVQEVLQKGDDNEARNIIKEKLCSLGLMQCDAEIIQGKRPYISPEDLVYAQPVDIKPIGRPIASIPIKRPIGPSQYGPPRPLPGAPNKFSLGGPIYIPPKKGYNQLQSPFYQQTLVKPPNLAPVGFYPPKPLYTEPIEPESPYKYETVPFSQKKQFESSVLIKNPIEASQDSVQQHVHHHFHHEAGKVDIDPINKPASSGFQISSYGTEYLKKPYQGISAINYGGQNIASYGGGLGNYGSEKPVVENFAPQTFEPNTFGSTVGLYGNSGHFGSSGLYKKEFNVKNNENSIHSNYLQSSYAGNYQGLESARAENYDCVCVPYDQCPSQDVIGRKDDLYYAIDPRNLKSNIEADTEERVITDGNGTMTIVRVPKNINDRTLEKESNEDNVKKLVKREEPVQNENTNKTNVQARLGMYDNKNIKPTFGVSFGLPNQGGGGYPITPFGNAPNPYNGAIGAGGINLGLISVNPLLAVQVTKDEYGEKVVKPFVNFHVTPNNFLVHKFEDFLAYKKGIHYNSHDHYHQSHYKPYYHQHDHFHSPPNIHFQRPKPLIYESHPPNFYKPLVDDSFPPNHYNVYDNSPIYGGDFEGGYDADFYGRAQVHNITNQNLNLYQNSQQDNLESDSLLQNQNQYAEGKRYFNSGSDSDSNIHNNKDETLTSNQVKFPNNRRRRNLLPEDQAPITVKRQAYYQDGFNKISTCGPRHVCCKKPYRPLIPAVGLNVNQCGKRHSQGINGRIKNPVYVDGDSEFGEYPWQVAILKKDSKESVYVCGGTLIDHLHIITAAHCVKSYTSLDLRVRLGEWDVNHDVEFYPYLERDVIGLEIHPEFYAGTLYNDIAILRIDRAVDWNKNPHISPACLPSPQDDYSGRRCWTTGWGKDAFGEFGKYQNILKEVDVPVVGFSQCQQQLQQTRLGYDFKLHPGFICAGGEEGKDACKGDGGGPMVCERGGIWQIVGIVSWGIGCGQYGVPGVYVRVAHYLDWIRQVTQRF